MYRTRGIILKKSPFKDVDKIFIVYTEKYGKKQLLAKGSKKIKSKLAGHLMEFSEIDFDFVQGKTHEKITGAEIKNNYHGIKNDLRKIVLGSFVVDVVDNFLKWDYPDLETYNLLLQILELINSEKNIKKAHLFSYIFIWKLLNISGHRPALDKCARCGRNLSGKLYFEMDGIICPHCALDRKDLMAISENTLHFLRGKSGSASSHKEIISIIEKFMRHHLEKVLKSEVWLGKLFSSC